MWRFTYSQTQVERAQPLMATTPYCILQLKLPSVARWSKNGREWFSGIRPIHSQGIVDGIIAICLVCRHYWLLVRQLRVAVLSVAIQYIHRHSQDFQQMCTLAPARYVHHGSYISHQQALCSCLACLVPVACLSICICYFCHYSTAADSLALATRSIRATDSVRKDVHSSHSYFYVS